MERIELNKQAKLSPHFTVGELCKTSVNSLDGNIPGQEEIENLKRLCPWLEELRARYNRLYVLPIGATREGQAPCDVCDDHSCASPCVSPEEPIIISSGFRSPEVNRCVGGVHSSNHLTGCAVDIRCVGVEQAIRYAAILLDTADEWKQDYDELLIERNRHGRYWVHFAVRPPKEGNRRKTMFLNP